MGSSYKKTARLSLGGELPMEPLLQAVGREGIIDGVEDQACQILAIELPGDPNLFEFASQRHAGQEPVVGVDGDRHALPVIVQRRMALDGRRHSDLDVRSRTDL